MAGQGLLSGWVLVARSTGQVVIQLGRALGLTSAVGNTPAACSAAPESVLTLSCHGTGQVKAGRCFCCTQASEGSVLPERPMPPAKAHLR